MEIQKWEYKNNEKIDINLEKFSLFFLELLLWLLVMIGWVSRIAQIVSGPQDLI